ncbi:hypothetical protein [Arthrobacter sp. SX1312]|nr:hypothetical protein [Arthrobacter sp. SX1312]
MHLNATAQGLRVATPLLLLLIGLGLGFIPDLQPAGVRWMIHR